MESNFDPNSVCLAIMVHSFIEHSRDRQKCSQNKCNCFNEIAMKALMMTSTSLTTQVSLFTKVHLLSPVMYLTNAVFQLGKIFETVILHFLVA